MFQSLRLKIIAAFSLVILLTIILSGVLSAWMTSSRFEVLVTSEGQYQAEEIVPLIEANYAIANNWHNLNKLFNTTSSETAPPDLFEYTWYSDTNWVKITADELKVDEETLLNQWEQGQSLATIAEKQGVNPKLLEEAIIKAEKNAIEQAIQKKEINAQEADDIFDWMAEDAEYFVYIETDPIEFTTSAEIVWTDESVNWLLNSLLLGDKRLLVADEFGVVIYDSEDLKYDEILPDEMLEQGAWLWDYEQDEPIGTVIVATGAGYYNAQQIAFLDSSRNALIVSGFLAGTVALLMGLVFARRITSPVTALTSATHHIAEGHWNERLPVNSDDELGQMSAAFNAMAESLENQRALRNRLVDDVRHELSTPLSVIQLELEALDDGMQNAEEASVQIKIETELLKNLVNDLDLLTEFGDGKLSLDFQHTNLSQLLNNSVKRWQPKAEEKEISLTLKSSENLPELAIDAHRISQVLGNIISNALQHTPPKGEIEVHALFYKKESIIITISDNGVGIPEKDLPHIFERFYRADYARSKETGGRGLGLAIVKEIVELHGGKVWVKSVERKGSVFGFELPVYNDN